MKARLLALVRSNYVIVFNAGSLVGASAVTSVLGFVYWWVAARGFSPVDMGFAAAAISAMTLLGNLGILGLGTLLIGELGQHRGRESGLIVTALITVGTASALLGLIFAVSAPSIAKDFEPLGSSTQNTLLFALGVGVTSIALVLDQALLGLLRGGIQFWRNAVFAIAKLILLVVAWRGFEGGSGLVIYATWFFGNVISFLVVAKLAVSALLRDSGVRFEWGLLRGLGTRALSHHALNLASSASTLLLPVIVTIMLSAQTNAYFYASWRVAAFAFLSVSALATTLYAVGAADKSKLTYRLRFTLALSFAAGLAGTIVVIPGAADILGLFGEAYAEESSVCLRILIMAVFPLSVKYHFIAISRVHGRLNSASRWIALGSGFELLLSSLGAGLGSLTGLSLGWLVAISLEAALMARSVYSAAAGRSTQAAATPDVSEAR